MPIPEIRTARMLLRPWTRDDIDALHELWTAHEVRQYLWDGEVIPRATVEEIVESHLKTAEEHGIGYWILHPAEGALAGFCGFRFVEDGSDVEVIYGLRRAYWGMGLATEACSAALDYLWKSTGFQRVFARTDPPNTKSIQVMERLRMTRVLDSTSLIQYLLLRPARATRRRQ